MTVNNNFSGARQPIDPRNVSIINKAQHDFEKILDRLEFDQLIKKIMWLLTEDQRIGLVGSSMTPQ